MQKGTPLGIALFPAKESQLKVGKIVEKLLEIDGFSSQLDPKEAKASKPHLTLFQGNFFRKTLAKKAFNLLGLGHCFSEGVLGTTVWAERIIFLEFVRSKRLTNAHSEAFELFFPLSSGKPADSQNFSGISKSEEESIRKTGYPFSNRAFRPHITLGTLDCVKFPFTSINCPKRIIFDRLALHTVGPGGTVKEIICEKFLSLKNNVKAS